MEVESERWNWYHGEQDSDSEARESAVENKVFNPVRVRRPTRLQAGFQCPKRRGKSPRLPAEEGWDAMSVADDPRVWVLLLFLVPRFLWTAPVNRWLAFND
ncbi:hypothetical protein EYF80_020132 [Liparis tanakae]|uniref:Uncharacterized protein n=1 Tax=Liparis tanakae TaxID=230148 RepID=A0A4Z2HXJ1_9TELE|nr:hypothetical protein EYF80_020132 [Liparis tanakae]